MAHRNRSVVVPFLSQQKRTMKAWNQQQQQIVAACSRAIAVSPKNQPPVILLSNFESSIWAQRPIHPSANPRGLRLSSVLAR